MSTPDIKPGCDHVGDCGCLLWEQTCAKRLYDDDDDPRAGYVTCGWRGLAETEPELDQLWDAHNAASHPPGSRWVSPPARGWKDRQ